MNVRYNQSMDYGETVSNLQSPLSNLYQSFIAWSSLYDAVDYQSEQEQRKEQVDRLLDEFRNLYLPQSVWMDRKARKTIERFIEKCESLRSEFTDDIQERGYVEARADMADRVSGELGPLRKEIEFNLLTESEEARPPWRRIFGG
jgi:hypothetical protein